MGSCEGMLMCLNYALPDFSFVPMEESVHSRRNDSHDAQLVNVDVPFVRDMFLGQVVIDPFVFLWPVCIVRGRATTGSMRV